MTRRPGTDRQTASPEEQEFLTFELPAHLYFNSANIAIAPKLEYKGQPISGGWQGRYSLHGTSTVKIRKEAWLESGKRFLALILENDRDFTRFFQGKAKKMIALADRLQKTYAQDVKTGNVTPLSAFIEDYRETFCYIIGMGFPIDTALEDHLREERIDTAHAPTYGISFLKKEEHDLAKITSMKTPGRRLAALEKHTYRYGWLLNNYAGDYYPGIDYFKQRLSKIGQEDHAVAETIVRTPPKSLLEWIGYLVFVRDQRKRLNMIVNGLLDRYLQDECARRGIAHDDAVMLSFDEFEEQKERGIRKYGPLRYVRSDRQGLHDLTPAEWEAITHEKTSTTGIVKGMVANKGKVRGVARIVLHPSDFGKVQQGDILVASMTRPEFAPVLSRCAGIITNEGGVTCHAAIISREMGKPCIIGTKTATKTFKDGDLVELDADKGIAKIVYKQTKQPF